MKGGKVMADKPTKEETLAKMDEKAKEARAEYNKMADELDKDTMDRLRSWWTAWFPEAGHNRLAYILLGRPLKGE